MIQNKIVVIFLMSLSSMIMLGQEVCDNGIDDDNDGLIDLQDSDCNCNGIDIIVPSSLFPNPSFEESDCQPGFGRADCAVGWLNPSEATPDYYDKCDILINPFIPPAPCPVPDGEKLFGLANLNINSQAHQEYVGTKLTTSMQAGEEYVLSFWIGFTHGFSNFTSSDVDFGVYGNIDASAVDTSYLGKSCPTTANQDVLGRPITPWDEITITHIANPNNVDWMQIRIEFIPSKNYEAILLGPSCASPTVFDYYFLDNLVLSTKGSFSTDFISKKSGLACNGDLVLEVPDMSSFQYQWYKDLVGLVGETSSAYQVQDLPTGNGNYTCIVSNSLGCSMSTPYEVNEQKPELTFDAPSGICAGTPVTIGIRESFVTYAWANGLGSLPTIEVDQPDVYGVEVVDAGGCRVTASLNLQEYPEVAYTTQLRLETAPGTSDGQIEIIHETGVTTPAVLWWDGDMNNPKSNLSRGNYCVTITADEHCPVEECIDLPLDIQPIVISDSLTPVRCYGEETGAIQLAVSGGLAPYSISWTDHPEWHQLLSIVNLKAGDYQFSLMDQEETHVQFIYSVGEPDIMTAELDIMHPQCHGSIDGVATVLNMAGGNGNEILYWNQSTQAGDQTLTALNAGDLSVRLEDVKGCELELHDRLLDPAPLTVTMDIESSLCRGADDGSIQFSKVEGGRPPYQYRIDGLSAFGTNDNLEGDQTYHIQIIDQNNCEYQQNIYLGNQEMMYLNIGEDRMVEEYYETTVIATADQEITELIWSTSAGQSESCVDCPVLTVEVLESMLIVADARSTAGCLASDTIFIRMTPSKRIYIPTAFSPNGDGTNDRLEFYNAGEVQQVRSFRIYNRLGGNIFSIQNQSLEQTLELLNLSLIDRGLESGVLVYTVDLNFKDGTSKQIIGEIMIIK